MNKTAFTIWEFIGLILSLIGLIGLFQTASEIIYRQRPLTGFMIERDDFLAMMKNGNDKSLLEQLLMLDMNHGMDKDPDMLLGGLTQIIHEYPDYLKGYYFRGLIYLSAGRVADGIADMQVVIKQSGDSTLRRQARKEIALARFAQVITPIPFLGLIAAVLFYVLKWAELIDPSWLVKKISFLIGAGIVWVMSFLFLLLH
jgi:hypothetical protein